MTNGSARLEDFLKRSGCEIGVSEWFVVDQFRISHFADVSEDHNPIHVDYKFAAESKFGSTIAHGFLTLSLLAPMRYGCCEIAGIAQSVNYGFNKVRFITPVKSGSKIRGRFVQIGLVKKKPGVWEQSIESTVEIEGQESPALVAEWILQHFE